MLYPSKTPHTPSLPRPKVAIGRGLWPSLLLWLLLLLALLWLLLLVGVWHGKVLARRHEVVGVGWHAHGAIHGHARPSPTATTTGTVRPRVHRPAHHHPRRTVDTHARGRCDATGSSAVATGRWVALERLHRHVDAWWARGSGVAAVWRSRLLGCVRWVRHAHTHAHAHVHARRRHARRRGRLGGTVLHGRPHRRHGHTERGAGGGGEQRRLHCCPHVTATAARSSGEPMPMPTPTPMPWRTTGVATAEREGRRQQVLRSHVLEREPRAGHRWRCRRGEGGRGSRVHAAAVTAPPRASRQPAVTTRDAVDSRSRRPRILGPRLGAQPRKADRPRVEVGRLGRPP